MDIKEVLLQWFINFFIKDLLVLKAQMVLSKVKLCQNKNQLQNEKFEKLKAFPSLKDNICDACPADKQLIHRFNKGYRFILYGNGIYGKYVCVLLLEDKKGIIIIKDFQKNLNESNGKPNIV